MITINDIISDVKNAFADREIYFDRTLVPKEVIFPQAWDGFGLKLEEPPMYPKEWQYYANELPSVVTLLNDSLLGTVLLADNKVELLYVFHDANGFYYYIGGQPVGGRDVEAAAFHKLPKRLQQFYSEVHDGFTFFPARSMGPQCISDMSRVSDFIDEDDVSFADCWVTVFSNGAGDYVAANTKSEDEDGLIWWHEDPMNPERDIEIFEIMDAWMAIFLEDTKSRDELSARFH